MYYIASVSFGKDSLAMLLKLIEQKYPVDEVVFYNTGMEFESIYQIRDRMKEILRDIGIKFTELRPDNPFVYDMFTRPVKYRDGSGYHYGYSWCGGRCRWGTRNKQAAIKKYKSSIDDHVTDYVGIAFDEIDRIAQNRDGGKVLPLVDLGMKETDCLSYCYQHGFDWIEKSGDHSVKLYDILDRVSCWCCSNKNLSELRNMYHLLPEYWEKLKALQSQTDRPMKGYGSVFELEERFRKEDDIHNGKKKEND